MQLNKNTFGLLKKIITLYTKKWTQAQTFEFHKYYLFSLNISKYFQSNTIGYHGKRFILKLRIFQI